MYAVIESGGKQYRVAEGDVIKVETLPVAEGDNIQLDRVLLVAGEQGVTVGNPIVEGATVTATCEGHGRGKKVVVYRHKKNYHRKRGHRQNYTRLRIGEISIK